MEISKQKMEGFYTANAKQKRPITEISVKSY